MDTHSWKAGEAGCQSRLELGPRIRANPNHGIEEGYTRGDQL